MVVNPYLNFNGNTEEVFNFYKSVFGGEFAFLQRYKDIPKEDNTEECVDEVPHAEGNKIMHMSLNIGSTMLMGTDVPSNMEQVKSGTNLSLCISVDSRADADRIFAGLAEGGHIQMPLQDMFWGDYYGMLTDKYEVQWMISFNPANDGKNNKA
ncbi:VOC family protein [Pedobacter frigiditerrae]|uniref:VOC family protein n=1 Tax=Pedobacter frigiditerrae TaxID=2530452 RepID=UPI002930132F|nr:VOC family protein [Pedobacter frigiditerrae]